MLATQEAEARESQIQGLPRLQNDFKTTLGSSVRCCLKIIRSKRYLGIYFSDKELKALELISSSRENVKFSG